MHNSIAVGLAEIKISQDPQDVLVAFGLGSCVGVGIFDPGLPLGGMLHAVLPSSSNSNDPNPAKYVDTGIQELLNLMVKQGLNRARMRVRIAGGANMLNLGTKTAAFDIGTRNIEMAKFTLNNLGIKIKSEEVGGQIGRTVRLYVCDGRMTIRVMGGKEREF